MAKECFKLGDKVLPINPERWAQGNNIGTIVSTEPTSWIIVEWKWSGTSQKSGYRPEEIKLAYQSGQMLFDFMYEN